MFVSSTLKGKLKTSLRKYLHVWFKELYFLRTFGQHTLAFSNILDVSAEPDVSWITPSDRVTSRFSSWGFSNDTKHIKNTYNNPPLVSVHNGDYPVTYLHRSLNPPRVLIKMHQHANGYSAITQRLICWRFGFQRQEQHYWTFYISQLLNIEQFVLEFLMWTVSSNQTADKG